MKTITFILFCGYCVSAIASGDREQKTYNSNENYLNNHQKQTAQGGNGYGGAVKNSGNSFNLNSNEARSKSTSNANSSSFSGSVASGGNVSGVTSASYAGGVNGFNGNGGASTSGSNVSTGAVTTTFNDTRQTPFAYSPGLSGSYSQENCANSASLGVSAGFGAIGGGMPIDNDGCNRRRDAQLWAAFGQNRIACERMAQDDDNAEAMKKAGLTCAALTVPVSAAVVTRNGYWDRMDARVDAQLARINQQRNK